MLNVEVLPFEPRHAEQHIELAQRAFAVFGEAARPKDSVEFVEHLHGDANPAGRALVASAMLDGRCAGSVSAIPARFQMHDGSQVTGWQIGFFVVDASIQRQGVGTKLLEAITAALKDRVRGFIYAYPNRRSIPVLDRYGYERLASIPTFIHLPSAHALFGPAHVHDAGAGVWDLESPRAADLAMELAPIVAGAAGAAGGAWSAGFVRDEAYFRWRFLGPDADTRYRFVVCREREGQGAFVIALARHVFIGLRFAILVDACPDVLASRLGIAVKAAQAMGKLDGARLVYVNTNALQGSRNEKPAGVPWRVRIPASRNPRPVELMMYPGTSTVIAEELKQSLVMTADWMGF